MGYGMKFLQEQYNVTASVAAICGGLVAFGGLIGAVLPIIGIKYLKWRGSTCLAVCSISSVMDFLKTMLSLGCPQTKLIFLKLP